MINGWTDFILNTINTALCSSGMASVHINVNPISKATITYNSQENDENNIGINLLTKSLNKDWVPNC